MLKALAGGDFEVRHTGTKRGQRVGLLGHLVPIDKDAYNAATNWWIDEDVKNIELV